MMHAPPAANAAQETGSDAVFSFLISALDSIAIGVIAVDRSLKHLHSNHYAREILDGGGSFCLSGSALSCQQPADANRLRTAVMQCTSGEASPPIVFRVYDHRRADYLEVAVRGSGSDGTPTPLACIYLRSPGPQTGIPDVLLAELYGLTRAERQIASLLTQEGSVTVAAKVRGVSPSTARTHLRSLLRKTGARRQVDLVQRLSTGLCGLVRFGAGNERASAQAPAQTAEPAVRT